MNARLLALLTLSASVAGAHELVVEAEFRAPSAIVQASYYDKAQSKDADVDVYPPGESSDPFVSGRTDPNGVFAFVPDQAGAWRVVVDDGRGHRESIDVAVDDLGASQPFAARAERNPVDRALGGVGVIFGLTGLWLWRRSRAPGGTASS